MNKRGQLSYEYIVVIGMILLLAIPFFYSFFRYLIGGFNTQMNADMVIRVSHAAETLANLGGVGSKFTVPVRISRVTDNDLDNNRLSVQTSNGQRYSSALFPKTIVGSEALVGDGFENVPLVYTYLETVVIGRQPQIVGICPEGEDPYSQLCLISTSVQPSEGFRVLGANFQSNSEIIISRSQGSGGSGCQTMADCEQDSDCVVGQTCENGICSELNPPITVSAEGLIADVSTAQTGVGTYDVAIANPGGELSDCVSMQVVAQGAYAECGNSLVEDGEECDPPAEKSDQCIGEGGDTLACKSNCKCEND